MTSLRGCRPGFRSYKGRLHYSGWYWSSTLARLLVHEIRPQGRSVYYRLARPELGSLLEAAETLLAAPGQRVRLPRHDGQADGTTPA